jgi:hypothetical protein
LVIGGGHQVAMELQAYSTYMTYLTYQTYTNRLPAPSLFPAQRAPLPSIANH